MIFAIAYAFSLMPLLPLLIRCRFRYVVLMMLRACHADASHATLISPIIIRHYDYADDDTPLRCLPIPRHAAVAAMPAPCYALRRFTLRYVADFFFCFRY